MARAPFQVLVFPYQLLSSEGIEYAIFLRSGEPGFWQGIAGGGEDAETPLEAAKREAFEEGAVSPESSYLALDSVATIPVVAVRGRLTWGDHVLVIPEHCFGVRIDGQPLRISREHVEFRWVGYDDAVALLKYDSNKNALWELDWRLRR